MWFNFLGPRFTVSSDNDILLSVIRGIHRSYSLSPVMKPSSVITSAVASVTLHYIVPSIRVLFIHCRGSVYQPYQTWKHWIVRTGRSSPIPLGDKMPRQKRILRFLCSANQTSSGAWFCNTNLKCLSLSAEYHHPGFQQTISFRYQPPCKDLFFKEGLFCLHKPRRTLFIQSNLPCRSAVSWNTPSCPYRDRNTGLHPWNGSSDRLS